MFLFVVRVTKVEKSTLSTKQIAGIKVWSYVCCKDKCYLEEQHTINNSR